MTSLLSLTLNIGDAGKIGLIVGVLVFLVIEIVVMLLVNKAFKTKYNYSLYGGSLAMIFSLALLGAAIALFVEGNMLGIVCLMFCLIVAGFVLAINIKKCGVETGIKAFILQILLCVGALFDFSRVSEYMEKRRQEKARYYQQQNLMGGGYYPYMNDPNSYQQNDQNNNNNNNY